MEKLNIKIKGMHYKSGPAVVETKSKIDNKKIEDTIEDLGFKVENIENM